MQDRPNADELLSAVENFLREEVVEKTEGSLRYNGRVAANVIAIIRRELEQEEAQVSAEWDSINDLLGDPPPRPRERTAVRAVIDQRTETLIERIRAGDADAGEFRTAVLAHLRLSVRNKLTVTNPAWLD